MSEEKKITGKIFDLKLFKRLLSYIKNYRFAFYISVIAVLLLAGFAIIRPILLKQIIDQYITFKIADKLLFYSLLMFGVLILEIIFQFTFIFFANFLGQNIIKDIRIQLFKHISNFKMNYFNNTAVGKIVTRVVSDIETIASVFGQGLFMIISDILKMFAVILVMLFTNWRLAIIALLALPVLIYATKIFQKAMKSAFQEVRNEVSNLNSFVQERLTGMKIVQLFSREKLEYNQFIEINNRHKKAWIRTVWYNSIFFPIAEIVPSIILGIIVWYGGTNMLGNGTTSSGDIISFIMMTQMLFRPLRQIADKFNTLQMGMIAADRVFKIIDDDQLETNKSEISLTKSQKFKGDIEFNNVHFSYLKDEEVLKGISFNIKKGKTIAVVGSTGAGKSTIINLLNRFYDINSGTITIDGNDLYSYDLNNLRQQIAIVLQDVFLFSDTIFNNITLRNPHINLEEVKKAAKQIGIHDFIMSLPDNYSYNVKERGVMLSSGQRQLIAFLRAYVSKPSILILDEATSSIDSQSELLIQKATEIITKDRTSIIIAHRLATIKNADFIIVMDQGEIVEQGNHKELLNLNGVYSNLYEMQFNSKSQ